METKFKVGDKVRILDVDAISGGEYYWKNGDIAEVVTAGYSEAIEVAATLPKSSGRRSDALLIFRREFHAIERIEAKPTKKRRIEILEKEVARQDSEIEALKEAVEALKKECAPKTPSIAQFLSDAVAEVTSKRAKDVSCSLASIKTPNQRRAQIIADAKQFVEETVDFVYDACPEEQDLFSDYTRAAGHINVKFVVNADKRTVMALGCLRHCGDHVSRRAIAKCAPDDVFNADIGKAIAVGRLFGLNVECFINAPKPAEFAVGHVVQIAHAIDTDRVYGVGKITDVTSSPIRNYYDSATFKTDAYYPNFESPIGTPNGSKIIDDTEAQYE